jgi:hypothetical protein
MCMPAVLVPPIAGHVPASQTLMGNLRLCVDVVGGVSFALSARAVVDQL